MPFDINMNWYPLNTSQRSSGTTYITMGDIDSHWLVKGFDPYADWYRKSKSAWDKRGHCSYCRRRVRDEYDFCEGCGAPV